MKRTLVLALLALLGACDLADEPGTDPDDLSVSLQSSATTGTAPLRVTLTAAVLNAAGTPEYRWTIADETFEGESSRAYTFTEAGTFTASVSVTDDNAEASDSLSITVTAGDGSDDGDGGDDGSDGGDDGDDGGSAACQNPVNIPDDVLEGVVRGALNKETGDLTCADMASLEALDYTGALEDEPGIYPAITDLSGLEHATSLKRLLLFNNSIVDAGPLQNLTTLEELSLGSDDYAPFLNKVTDLTPLRNLVNLKHLDLSYSFGIRDISALARLTKLERLYLKENQISDITPLQAFSNLRDLNLEANQVGDIEPLVNNAGLGSGDEVRLTLNPLDACAEDLTDLQVLEARGVAVVYDTCIP